MATTSTVSIFTAPGGGDFGSIANITGVDNEEISVVAGATNIRATKLDNSANQSEPVHLALCNTVGVIVVGSYEPEEMLFAPKRGIVYQLIDAAIAFGTGLGIFVKKEPGTGGSTIPTSAPEVDFGLK